MQKKYILGGIIGNILFTSLLFGYIQQKQRPILSSENTLEQSLIRSSSLVRPSVVGIFAEQVNSYGLEDKQWADQKIKNIKQQYIEWSAFFIDTKGYLVTSKHVVPNEAKTYSVILDDDRSFPVQKIWRSPNVDIAILYIGQDKHQISFPVVDIVNTSATASVWSIALTIGTPFSQYTNTVSLGIISAIWRNLTLDWGNMYTGLYQLDININPWNSWWPVINSDWKVFGLVTAMASQSSHIGFALPISQNIILNLLNQIKSSDTIK